VLHESCLGNCFLKRLKLIVAV